MIGRWWSQFTLFLGPARLRTLLILVGGTGLLSLILNAVDSTDTIRLIQSLLALGAVIGSGVIIVGKMDAYERGRWIGLLIPAIGLLLIGTFLLPQFSLALAGAAFGWVVAGALIFRPRTPMELRAAVKHLRKNEYAEAVQVMDDLIKVEPDDPDHYRFRAELLRLWGKLDRAKRDYRKVTQLQPNSPLGFNGLAEVCLQARAYDEALIAAQRAVELAPNDWVALYNLGMIEDRLKRSNDVVTHLVAALKARVTDARHRLLIHLYLTRAYARLGDADRAQTAVAELKKHASGLEAWQKILESDQAAPLRDAIGTDIAAAQAIIFDDQDVMLLAVEP